MAAESIASTATPPAAAPAAFIYTPELAQGRLRPGHPLKLARVRTCYELLAARGAIDGSAAHIVPPQPAGVADILNVHTPEYVDLVRDLSAHPERTAGDLAGEAGR